MKRVLSVLICIALCLAHTSAAFADSLYGLEESAVDWLDSGTNEIHDEAKPNSQITISGFYKTENESNIKEGVYKTESAIALGDENEIGNIESESIIPEIDMELEESLKTVEDEEIAGTSLGLNVEMHSQADIAEYLKKVVFLSMRIQFTNRNPMPNQVHILPEDFQMNLCRIL